jgi:hypothetical protein
MSSGQRSLRKLSPKLCGVVTLEGMLMIDGDRRNLPLTRRDMVLGMLTAGTVAARIPGGSGVETVHAQTTSPLYTEGFGWKVSNLGKNCADIHFVIQRDLILKTVDVDLSFALLSPPAVPGMAVCLCGGAVSRGGPPAFHPGANSFFASLSSSTFGAARTYNPSGLTIGNHAAPFQDTFLSLIWKAWAPIQGKVSGSYRHVQVAPSFSLKAGDYLVFNMGHDGPPVDVEMQTILVFE